MNKLREKFTSQKMSWVFVLIFAVLTGAVTAGLNLIPALKDTSLQDPAIYYDVWFLFAIFIVVNCKKWWEASLKTFVFFLVSQPLIFLIEVPFTADGFGIFRYYKYWFIITILTLPGAAIAYQIKRKDTLSLIVLSVATGYLGFAAADHLYDLISSFPNHLISVIFCVVVSVMLVFIILDKKWHRIVGVSIIAVVMIVSLIVTKPITDYDVTLPEGNWTYEIDDSSVVSVEDNGDGNYKLVAEDKGIAFVLFTDEKGNKIEYAVTVTGGGIYCDTVD